MNPTIHPSATIAPNAYIQGDVTIGENVRVMHGAQIIAESNSIEIGDNCIVLENAVLRGTANGKLSIGSNCLIGPNTHLAGCIIGNNVFIATGASVFHGAVVKEGCEVRINAVVHLKTVLEPGTTVPIGWIAVGNPSQLFSPDKHEEIWAIQKELNFPEYVYGLKRDEASMEKICKVMGERLKLSFQ